ncbi:tetratricopeptide repeat protein [bacterium]|nr:tetratricopeptide repeat protein [bacterium]
MKKTLLLLMIFAFVFSAYANYYKDYNAGVNYKKMKQYAAAEKSFLSALKDKPSFTLAMWGLIEVYNLRHQKVKALAVLDKIIAAKPKNKEAYLVKARMLVNLSRNKEAKYFLNKLREIDPKNIDGQILEAQVLNKTGNNEGSIAKLETIAKSNNDKAGSLYKQIGDIAFKDLRDYNRAIKYYKYALSNNVLNKDSINKKIAYSYFLRQDWTNGINYINKAGKAQIGPADLKWLGMAYEKTKDINNAIKFYEKYYEKKKGQDTAIKLSELYKKIGNTPKYKYYLNIAQNSTSIDYKTAYKLGYQLLKQKKYAEAIKQFEKSIAGKDDFYGSWYAIGFAQYKYGQKNRALESFLKAEKLNPTYVYTLRYIAMIYDNNKNFDKGLLYWRKIAALQPNDPEVYYFIGLDAGEVKDYTTSAAALSKVVKLQPKNKDAWYNLSVAYENLEKPNMAANALEKYNELGGE